MGARKHKAVLKERIRALDRRVDDRFIALEKRIDERFQSLADALKLAAAGHNSTISTWLSLAAIASSFLIGLIVIWKGH